MGMRSIVAKHRPRKAWRQQVRRIWNERTNRRKLVKSSSAAEAPKANNDGGLDQANGRARLPVVEVHGVRELSPECRIVSTSGEVKSR